MRRTLTIFFLSVSFLIVSCKGEKVCSGLNPNVSTYNSNGKIRKGSKGMSAPERAARKHRIKANNKKYGLKSHTAYAKHHGRFHIDLHFKSKRGGQPTISQ